MVWSHRADLGGVGIARARHGPCNSPKLGKLLTQWRGFHTSQYPVGTGVHMLAILVHEIAREITVRCKAK